jgi:hypothetical protein
LRRSTCRCHPHGNGPVAHQSMRSATSIATSPPSAKCCPGLSWARRWLGRHLLRTPRAHRSRRAVGSPTAGRAQAGPRWPIRGSLARIGDRSALETRRRSVAGFPSTFRPPVSPRPDSGRRGRSLDFWRFAGVSCPLVSVRERSKHPRPSMVRKGSSVRVRQRAPRVIRRVWARGVRAGRARARPIRVQDWSLRKGSSSANARICGVAGRLNTSLQAVRPCPLVTHSWHRTRGRGLESVESAVGRRTCGSAVTRLSRCLRRPPRSCLGELEIELGAITQLERTIRVSRVIRFVCGRGQHPRSAQPGRGGSRSRGAR